MLSPRLVLFLSLYSVITFGQPYPATTVYPSLTPYIIINVFPNDNGFQCIARTHILVSDTLLPPGLLLQIDHDGQLLDIDTLRNNKYIHAYKVDSFFLFSGYNYYKHPDTLSTWVFEICDLNGNVMVSYQHDLVSCFPGMAGVAKFNDSIYIGAQFLECWNGVHESIYYYVNIKTLETIKKIKPGGIDGSILKIEDNPPRYLEWLLLDIWIMDSTFINNNKVFTDSVTPSQGGALLLREDKPGWFGFGGCITPSGVYQLCMLSWDDQFNLDKVDVIYHPPSGHWYIPASNQPLCKQGDAYYVTGQWNVPDQFGWWYNKTPTEVVIAKYDLNLNRVWTKIVGGDRRYWPTEIHPTKQGGFMIAGGLIDNLDNYKRVPFTMFFDADGEVVGTQEPTQGRYEFTIYGNPGREALRILSRFEGRKVLLQVVNAMGQPMLHRYMTEGMNDFDTSYWPSGTYLMSITDDRGEVLWSQPWIRAN